MNSQIVDKNKTVLWALGFVSEADNSYFADMVDWANKLEIPDKIMTDKFESIETKSINDLIEAVMVSIHCYVVKKAIHKLQDYKDDFYLESLFDDLNITYSEFTCGLSPVEFASKIQKVMELDIAKSRDTETLADSIKEYISEWYSPDVEHICDHLIEKLHEMKDAPTVYANCLDSRFQNSLDNCFGCELEETVNNFIQDIHIKEN